jgi:uncharacterized membrane protein
MLWAIALMILPVAACGGEDDPGANAAPAAAPAAGNAVNGSAARTDGAAGTAPSTGASGAWDLQSSGEGTALALRSGEATTLRFFCPAGANRLLVNVPGFRAIGSEERLSFGSGGDAAALVADSRGDRARGGVSATGAVPADLAALLARPVSASYGAQTSGPHPAPARRLVLAFVAACGRVAAAPPAAPNPPAPPRGGACMMQGSERLTVRALRAVGTEPFWGARVEGRCVTYSHPDDQQGTRIWTRYTAGPGGRGTWSGALGGRRFELRARPQPGCSDGMSDRVYPIAVELFVGGERRTGCAEPA